MQCEELADVLVDLVDGRLAPDQAREAERHLEGCAACRALVTDLRTIRASAFTLDRREPAAAVWASLAAKVAAEPAPAGRVLPFTGRSAWAGWLAAAAALVIATLVGVWPLVRDRREAVTEPAATPAATVESVAAEFAAAEQHYQKAITDLEAIAKEDSGALDPQVAAVLQKNLGVIDQAISESRAALKTQPTNLNAQNGLFDALRTKVALLQQTVELINEMRQGNQAEAGRRIQGLSQ